MRDSKRLLSIFRSLSEPRQQALLEYAEFLATKEGVESASAPATEPLPIPRPAQENVVKAIQRLMQTYPMLERNHVFHEASAQMTRHLIHGVPAIEAIDELERIFARQYQQHLEALKKDPLSS
jgi:D-aminopeptidase